MAEGVPPSSEAPPDKLALQPPPEQEDVPPPYANQVRVYGGTDAVVIEFYYMNHAKYFDALRGESRASNVERVGDTIRVVTAPVARVAISLSTATDLFTNVAMTLVGGAPDMQRVFSEFGRRMAALVAEAQEFASKVRAPEGGAK